MSNIIQTRPHNRLRLTNTERFSSHQPPTHERPRTLADVIGSCLALCVGVQGPAMRGSSDPIELNGDDLRRDLLNVRKASAVELGRVLVGPN